MREVAKLTAFAVCNSSPQWQLELNLKALLLYAEGGFILFLFLAEFLDFFNILAVKGISAIGVLNVKDLFPGLALPRQL
jgi:hypothetical protein